MMRNETTTLRARGSMALDLGQRRGLGGWQPGVCRQSGNAER
jgi:hypothetical protein